MLREFGTFLRLCILCCSDIHSRVCVATNVFSFSELGADSPCRSQKEMEVVGKNCRLTNNINKYWKHAEKMRKPEIPRVSQRHLITIHKYSVIFGNQQRSAFNRVVFNET